MKHIGTLQSRLWNIKRLVRSSGTHGDKLENRYTGDCIVGSNPTLSASFEATLSCNAFTPMVEVADKIQCVSAGVPPVAV